MKLLIYILIFLTALLSLFTIDNYALAIIIISAYLFVNVLYLSKYKRDNLLCFEFFFALSFLLCTFLTVFVIPLMDTWQLRVFITDSELIRKTYIIGFLGYLFYLLALTQGSTIKQSNKLDVPKDAFLFSNILCLLFIIIFFLRGGIKLLYIYSDANIDIDHRTEGWGEFMVYSIISYCVSIPLNFKKAGTYISFSKFIGKLSPLFLLNSSILIVMLLVSGYRSQAFNVLLPLIIAFSIQIRPFKKWEVLVLIIGGVLLMRYIGDTRSGGTFEYTQINFLDSVKDFTSANAANGFLIDYTDQNGCTYGSNFVLRLFSIIPFLQGIVLSVVPSDVFTPSSSALFTSEMGLVQGGMGTGIIGDMYYSFSLPGVIVMMYLLGYICRNVSKLGSPYIWAMFMNFVGNALFLPRGEMVSIVRSMAFGVICMFFILKMSGSRK